MEVSEYTMEDSLEIRVRKATGELGKAIMLTCGDLSVEAVEKMYKRWGVLSEEGLMEIIFWSEKEIGKVKRTEDDKRKFAIGGIVYFTRTIIFKRAFSGDTE